MGEKFYCNDCFGLFDSRRKACSTCGSKDIRIFGGGSSKNTDSEGRIDPRPLPKSRRRTQDGRTLKRRWIPTWNFKPILVFVVSSVVLTLILNSTIWAYEGNPLGIQQVLTNTKDGIEQVAAAGSQNVVDDLRQQDADRRAEAELQVNLVGAYYQDALNNVEGFKLLILNVEYENKTDDLACRKPDYALQGSDLYVYPAVPNFEWNKEPIPCLVPDQIAFHKVAYNVPKDLDFYEFQIDSSSPIALTIRANDIEASDPGFASKPKLAIKAPGKSESLAFGALSISLRDVKILRVVDSSPRETFLVDFDLVAQNAGDVFHPVPDPIVYSSDGYFYRTEFMPPRGSDQLSSSGVFGAVPPGETRRATFRARLDSAGALQIEIRGYTSDASTKLETAVFYVSQAEFRRALTN